MPSCSGCEGHGSKSCSEPHAPSPRLWPVPQTLHCTSRRTEASRFSPEATSIREQLSWRSLRRAVRVMVLVASVAEQFASCLWPSRYHRSAAPGAGQGAWQVKLRLSPSRSVHSASACPSMVGPGSPSPAGEPVAGRCCSGCCCQSCVPDPTAASPAEQSTRRLSSSSWRARAAPGQPPGQPMAQHRAQCYERGSWSRDTVLSPHWAPGVPAGSRAGGCGQAAPYLQHRRCRIQPGRSAALHGARHAGLCVRRRGGPGTAASIPGPAAAIPEQAGGA